MKRHCRLIGKVLLWIAGILIVLRVAIPICTVAVANRLLPGLLGTAASIDLIDMVILRGRASTGGIMVYQPPGFDGPPLASLHQLTADIGIDSLFSSPLTIDTVTIDALQLNVIRNKDGVLNVESLAGGTTNAPASENEEPIVEGEPSVPVSVAIRELNIRDLAVSYRDLTYDPPLSVYMVDCDVCVTNLLFDPSQSGHSNLNSSVTLTARLRQPDRQDAFVGLTARLGILSTSPPPAVAAVRIIGLELKSGLDAVVPPGVSQALGGSCVDAYVDISMAPDILDCSAELKTEDTKLTIYVGGTPDNPQVDKSSALFNLVRRPTDLVQGVVTDVGSAGVEVVGGAAKTTAAVGLGALKVVGSVGKGFLKTAKGVATADLEEVGDGLKTATVGTVEETVDAVVDTATTVVVGVGDTASATVGKDDTDAWRAECASRWHSLWSEARGQVNEAPYPRPKETEEPPEPTTEQKPETEPDQQSESLPANTDDEHDKQPESIPPATDGKPGQ
jgi:hypothetical protein